MTIELENLIKSSVAVLFDFELPTDMRDCLQVLSETETKLNQIAMLERHIMQAEAKALSADERHGHVATEGLRDELGLPIGSNHFRYR